MLLTVDVGNTHTVAGLWRDNQLIRTARFSSDHRRTADEWVSAFQLWLGREEVLNESLEAAYFCSVVPAIEVQLQSAFFSLGLPGVVAVDGSTRFPFRFDVAKYGHIGADRLVNAFAGYLCYGKNLIIVDFGTAITFCRILDGEYAGGCIVPGIDASLSALSGKTARLPAVSFRKKSKILEAATRDAMESGSYYGWKGLVREILQAILAESGSETGSPPLVIATGGISPSLGFASDFFDVVDPSLTLKGLNEVYRYNMGER